MPKFHKKKARPASISHMLESGTVAGIRKAKQHTTKHLQYQWSHYSELARQRSLIQDEIKQALIQTAISYELSTWQRAVKYKYGLHPLSTVGSLGFIGGRFNTGSGVNSEIPHFPGLYIAEDKDTALQEHLGQEENDKLTPREIALTNPASETIVSVSGKLDKVFDLTREETLIPFVNLIKNFKLSKELRDHAKRLGLHASQMIKTPELLLATLLQPNWRQLPSNFDVPANSQIFAHLTYLAGLEGILYPSKFTNKLCLVIFPRNFVGTDSFIQLDDEPPHKAVPNKIDKSNWRTSEMEAHEIIT